MVTWSNSSRESRLDYECNLFLRELMSYMQGSLQEFSIAMGGSTTSAPQSTPPARQTYGNWIWRNLIEKVLKIELGGGETLPSIEDTPYYFNNFELYSSQTFLDYGDLIVIMANRYPGQSRYGYSSYGVSRSEEVAIATANGEVSIDFGNEALYAFTLIQSYSPGDLDSNDNEYLKYCNRRCGDFILDISTGEIVNLGWIYDYSPPDPFNSEYRKSSISVNPVSSLSMSSSFGWNTTYLYLQGISYFTLNFPMGMPL